MVRPDPTDLDPTELDPAVLGPMDGEATAVFGRTVDREAPEPVSGGHPGDALENLLGLALMGVVRLDEADREFAESLVLAEADGDDRARAAALECRGLVAQEQGRDEEALALFSQVRTLKEAMGPHAVATLDLSVGRSLVNLGRFDHALEALDAALAVFVPPGGGRPADEVNVAKVRQERGRVLIAKRRWPEAREELDLALAGFAARGLAQQMAQVRVAMAGHAQLTGEQDWQDHLVEAERLYRENGNDAKAARLRTYFR